MAEFCRKCFIESFYPSKYEIDHSLDLPCVIGGITFWSKEELIEYILCLQHNLQCEENLNNHMYKTITQAMHNNPIVANEISKVLVVWNSTSGHRYSKGKVL